MTLVAAVLSGLLWLGGTGLHPIWGLTWVAPLPLLLASFRVRARTALGAAVLAWLIGQLGVLAYYHVTLSMPVPEVAGVVLLGAALAAGTVLLARALLLRGRTATAVLAVPALWVLGEYAASRLLPHGAWWSLAYTQADVRPVIQLTALTGVWGVTYLLVAVPVALAALRMSPRVAVACLLAVVAAAGGWSAWSLSRPTAGTGALTVGLAAMEQSDDGLPVDQASGRDLLARYVPRVAGLAARGARVVVLPEKVFGVTDTTLPVVVDAFRPVTSGGTSVVVGAVLRRPDTANNVALVLGAGGTVTPYAKQHLIPGLEDWLTPGHDDVIVDGRFGVAICKDLDFPGLVRRYRAQGARVMLVPALDFTSDGWLHSRMALVRGVEDGLTVVRAADYGRLTVTDARGRVLGEDDAQLLVTMRPAAQGTVYARTGDWFPVAAVPLFLLALWSSRTRAERVTRRTGACPPPDRPRRPGRRRSLAGGG